MKKDIFLKQPRRGKTHEVQLTPHKAEGRNVVMEATGRSMWTIPVILLLAVILTACDPGYNEDMLIRNASSHSVTVIPAPYSWYDSGMDSTHTWTNESYTLVPGQEVVIHHSGGIGAASFEEGVQAFLQYYSNSVTFRFDGELGPQVVYYAGDTTGISPYYFSSTLYQYEETRHYGRWFNGHPSYGKLTFTITDEHYQATEESNYLEVKN